MKKDTVSKKQLEILRKISGTQKVKLGAELYEMGRKIAIAGIRDRFPKISQEDLIITKLFWFKKSKIEKHLQDAKGIWEILGKDLDIDYLKKWARYLRATSLLQRIT